MKKVGVKYCGGCREQYDRKAAFEELQAGIEGSEAEFVPARDGGDYDELLVICGCPSKCADISKYKAQEIVMVDSKEGMNCLLKNYTKAN